ncbi:MAG: hypothetical protein B7Z58_14985 [Acidiphilium sp. 37-64-53]|uniref:DMT family transporter n=1 Tax=Acidiphilium sp. TaxID=527 RepID=UPI000BD3AE55|nr:SMR family transporter [Acidiphilium sp.]OYW00554.1 MAG: hypothetical protein B7Z58_14985 [Acidiphilium sp. 37-64-53]OZB23707.1 MAG: hypothetical protein B7X49_15755 [Acidiphilium sp. 34-64-41]
MRQIAFVHKPMSFCGRRRREGKRFFFEKKKQKTFLNWASGAATARDARVDVFLLLFFQKKKCLSSLSLIDLPESRPPMPSPYILLAIAILFEVAGTSFLKASRGFTQPVAGVLTVLFYAGVAIVNFWSTGLPH